MCLACLLSPLQLQNSIKHTTWLETNLHSISPLSVSLPFPSLVPLSNLDAYCLCFLKTSRLLCLGMMPGSACANPPPERSFVWASRSIRFILIPRILMRLRNDEAQAPLYPLTALLSNVPIAVENVPWDRRSQEKNIEKTSIMFINYLHNKMWKTSWETFKISSWCLNMFSKCFWKMFFSMLTHKHG